MKTILITTTREKEQEILKKYSVLCPDHDTTRVKVKVVIDDNNSEVFKNLSKDKDVLDWDFLGESSAIEDNLVKIKEVNLSENGKIDIKKELSLLDLKDMKTVISICKNYKECLEFVENSDIEHYNITGILYNSIHKIDTNNIPELSGELTKTVLTRMAEGIKQFLDKFSKSLVETGTNYLNHGLPVSMVSFEGFCKDIFDGNYGK